VKQSAQKHDVGLLLLSLVLAFILWTFAMAEMNPERSPRYDDIRVSLTGEEELLVAHGLSVIEMDTTELSVTVRGPNDEVTNKNMRQRISVSANVAGLTEAGEYDLTPTVNINRDGIEVINTTPSVVRVRVDQVTTASVPVRVDVSGNPKEGFRAGRPYPTMASEVKIEGPQSELKEVAYAYAIINTEGLESTKKEDCTITLCNDAGEPITGQHVTCRSEQVNVTLPIYKINTLPLTVTFKDGGTITASQATATFSPTDQVNVIGDQNTIAEMGELNLGEIDLGSVQMDVPITLPITLPEGVRLDDGQPDSIDVTITASGISTRKLEITRYAYNDTAEETPYQVKALTNSVTIELRGNQNALYQVNEQSFTIGLTYDSVSLGAGKHTVKGVVAATGLPRGVTLVEEDAQIEIEISLAEGETE